MVSDLLTLDYCYIIGNLRGGERQFIMFALCPLKVLILLIIIVIKGTLVIKLILHSGLQHHIA